MKYYIFIPLAQDRTLCTKYLQLHALPSFIFGYPDLALFDYPD